MYASLEEARDLYATTCCHPPEEFKPSKEHIENLKTLASYLESLPEDYSEFDILAYFINKNGEPIELRFYEVNVCKTAACAIGHGPLAGIEASDTDYTWTEYAQRVFGTDELTTVEGMYMFSFDNEDGHIPAAKRIREVLDSLLSFN